MIRRGMLGHRVLGMREGSGDILLVEPGAVIALDQQRHPAGCGQMPRPTECGIEGIAFLEQHSIHVQRRDCR